MAGAGVRFLQMAGNNEIMVTVLVQKDWQYDLPEASLLFSQPLLTRPAVWNVRCAICTES
jgi:hypothetical protein